VVATISELVVVDAPDNSCDWFRAAMRGDGCLMLSLLLALLLLFMLLGLVVLRKLAGPR